MPARRSDPDMGDALFYGAASRSTASSSAWASILPLAVGALPGCARPRVLPPAAAALVCDRDPAGLRAAYLHRPRPVSAGPRALSGRLLVFSTLQMLCLLICWWWDQRVRPTSVVQKSLQICFSRWAGADRVDRRSRDRCRDGRSTASRAGADRWKMARA